MFTDLSLQVSLGSVPSSQTKLQVTLVGQAISAAATLQITPYKEDGTKKAFSNAE